MYAYIDETGNTGARLLDDDQPLFVTAALLTRSDFDKRFGEEIAAIAESIGVEELHASQLGLGRIEQIAKPFLKVLRKAGPAFFLARVEKRYVLASKLFDTLFDSGENMAVAWHVYNSRPLRLMLVFKIAYILDDEIATAFWDALMDINDDRARSKMAEFCKLLLAQVRHVPDARSREIITQALEWAAARPEALEFVHADKIGRKSHLPNMVGFGNLLAGIERQSNVWKRPVAVITHDRQHEFATSLKFWHEIYSNALDDVLTLPLGEKMVLRKVFGSRLEISSGKDCAGIQVIDVILWLFSRSLRGDDIPPYCQAILDYVYSRAYQDDFSFAGVGKAAEALVDQMLDDPLECATLERAKVLQQELEERRLAQIAAYEAKTADDT